MDLTVKLVGDDFSVFSWFDTKLMSLLVEILVWPTEGKPLLELCSSFPLPQLAPLSRAHHLYHPFTERLALRSSCVST